MRGIECYSKCCTRLPDIDTPRYSNTLIHHNSSVYAFEGRDIAINAIKKAENIDMIYKESWIILNYIKRQRSNPLCIGINNEIYIIGGGDLMKDFSWRYQIKAYIKFKRRFRCINGSD